MPRFSYYYFDFEADLFWHGFSDGENVDVSVDIGKKENRREKIPSSCNRFFAHEEKGPAL